VARFELDRNGDVVCVRDGMKRPTRVITSAVCGGVKLWPRRFEAWGMRIVALESRHELSRRRIRGSGNAFARTLAWMNRSRLRDKAASGKDSHRHERAREVERTSS